MVLLVCSGCIIPSLSELEAERPRACDGEHPCLTGYECLAGLCASITCQAGETRACGSAVGECREGTQACNGGVFDTCVGGVGPVTEVCDGKDNDCDGTIDDDPTVNACELTVGVCSGKKRACTRGVAETTCSEPSYGPTFEVTETRCDDLDNDCDGQVDETLAPQPCALTEGVCAGATVACVNGAYATCTAADYRARSPAYQVNETLCDSMDNDCDGVTDLLSAARISDAGVSARRVAAVSRTSGDVLAFYETGAQLVARVLLADGGMLPERVPSTSVASAAMRAELPALAVSGSTVMEGWFEILPGPIHRLIVAHASSTGEAQVMGAPGISPVGTQMGPGQGLRLGLTASRLVLAWASFDATGTNSTVSISSCPIALDALCTTQVIGAGRNPALLIDGDLAFVGYDDASGAHLVRYAVPSTGAVTAGPTVNFGSATHDVSMLGTASAITVFYVETTPAPQSLTKRSGDCSAACSALSTTMGVVSFTGVPSNFSVEASAVPATLAWEEGTTGSRRSRAMRLNGAMPVDVGDGSRRPVPLVFPRATAPVILFDTEGSTNGVFGRGLCGF